MIAPVISGLFSLGAQWLQGKQEVSRAKASAKAAKITADEAARQKAMDQEGAWETLQAEGAKSSWKDEAWTIFFIALLVAGFVPDFRQTLDQWIAFVNELPDFVSIGIIISISASFGIRSIQSFTGRK